MNFKYLYLNNPDNLTRLHRINHMFKILFFMRILIALTSGVEMTNGNYSKVFDFDFVKYVLFIHIQQFKLNKFTNLYYGNSNQLYYTF